MPVLKKVLKGILWSLVGVAGIVLTGFGLYVARNSSHLPQFRGLNLLVMPGAVLLVLSYLNLKQLIFGYTFNVKGVGRI